MEKINNKINTALNNIEDIYEQFSCKCVLVNIKTDDDKKLLKRTLDEITLKCENIIKFLKNEDAVNNGNKLSDEIEKASKIFLDISVEFSKRIDDLEFYTDGYDINFDDIMNSIDDIIPEYNNIQKISNSEFYSKLDSFWEDNHRLTIFDFYDILDENRISNDVAVKYLTDKIDFCNNEIERIQSIIDNRTNIIDVEKYIIDIKKLKEQKDKFNIILFDLND